MQSESRSPDPTREPERAGAPDSIGFTIRTPRAPEQRLRISQDPDGRLPSRKEFVNRLLVHFKLKEPDDLAEDADDEPASDEQDTWLLRNVTQDRYVSRDDGQLDVADGDVLELQSRSVAG